MKKTIIVFETFIFICQLLVWLIFPIEKCKNYNCDGKLLGYSPIFIFVLAILYFINLVFYIFTFFQLSNRHKIKTFIGVITAYNLFFCVVLFLYFGKNLLNFEIITSLIQITANFILLSLYYLIYKER